jgi:hypothetical protein
MQAYIVARDALRQRERVRECQDTVLQAEFRGHTNHFPRGAAGQGQRQASPRGLAGDQAAGVAVGAVDQPTWHRLHLASDGRGLGWCSAYWAIGIQWSVHGARMKRAAVAEAGSAISATDQMAGDAPGHNVTEVSAPSCYQNATKTRRVAYRPQNDCSRKLFACGYFC